MIQWVIYDINNEEVYWVDSDYMPTDEDCQKNLIKMPAPQAERIRRAKGLPMPCPSVEVKYGKT